MRTAFMTVFLIVALQGIASASTALAAPADANSSAPAASATEVPSATAPAESDASKAQPTQRTDSERKALPIQPQVLSKNFQSPRPVQIYWFFGGR
jgi:hypothetical protein